VREANELSIEEDTNDLQQKDGLSGATANTVEPIVAAAKLNIARFI
jgi:hypothetical protein